MTPLTGCYESHAGNFFRPLNWRLMAAEQLAAATPGRLPYLRRPRKWPPTDAIVACLTAVLRAESEAPDGPHEAGLHSDVVAWNAAIALHKAGCVLRDEVEARLLAGQTHEGIAARCGLSPATIKLYEGAVFNVRDRLKARDWVVGRTIGHGPAGGLGWVWKQFAI